MERLTREERAALMRRQYRYMDMILKGNLHLPPEKAWKLIGPDRAYHLYRFYNPEKKKKR
ncbi:MAG: hypothetical protein D6726_12130 [Nitrospirae bacterium]|nr:MAG: hypothetical protein D6726_12130 [Nitrospirota bacterium]